MSMSIQVVGFTPPDECWTIMKAAWDACKASGLEPPDELQEFFDWRDPSDAPGVEIKLEEPCAKEWKDEYREGYEVDITALPEGVRFVRFFCSW